MLEENIKLLLKSLGYTPKNGTNNIYEKQYNNSSYAIIVDFNNKKIDYGTKIKIGNATTSNFSKPENFVVLECINRLLEKGYKPENIELEKIYPSGRGHSGNLDILVYDNNKNAYLMIECKTWGIEYKKEHNKMVKDGGQLFTYYALDRNAKFLCLYTSELHNGKIEYQNNIVPVESEWISLSTSKEIHTHWNKSFKDNGIFEPYASPYEIKHKALTYGMLTDLKEEDSGKIFNQIMEILRHNVVSDKPNAFNKLLNLFVCKIIDEDRNETEELHFQWFDDDTDETLQMRLNDLYKKGMHRFLNIDVTDYSENEINDALKGIDADDSFKQTIKEMFIDTRLKKSPNFAFKEVLDEKSFKANAKIVKEIVQLLQGYKFRYRQKHQFLGDFFELLLNTSMKQEAGQFFTPVPITRFIISSLPIEEMIINKIKNGDSEILPVVIDYAAGSGHFLTEYMEQVQNILEKFGMSLTTKEIDKIVDNINISWATPTIKNKIRTWIESEKFIWAKDYVYGIDLDDRLVKTAKVSAFFNGDGEANIIWANGLDNFKKSSEYIGKLRETQNFDKKNNGQFDILISNPPYSVEAFKSTLKNGKETFELYDNLTDNSSEIECLFVERMKQLLKVGGWAGVILPISILSNGGIYSKTREIIIKYFKIKSIVELGSGTFMKTGTNTIILFLERRADSDYKEIERAIDKFFEDNLDVTVLGIENVFSKYVTNVYNDLSLEKYLKIINGEFVEHELYNDYKKEFKSDTLQIRNLEKEKLLYFILTYKQNTVIIKTGKKQEEKNFLGYEFSERRGHEGLKWLPNGTKLYNENDLLDKTKANSYIYNAFLNNNQEDIDDALSNNIFYEYMSDLFEYGTNKFDKRINLNKKKAIHFSIDSKYNFEKLGNIAKISKGTSITKAQTQEGKIKVVAGGLDFAYYHNISNRPKNTITVSASGANAGYVNYWQEEIFASDCTTINADNFITQLYIYYCLKFMQNQIFSLAKGQAQPHVYPNDLSEIKIPLPSILIQEKIVEEINNIDEEIQKNNAIISNFENEKNDIIDKCFNSSYELETLGNLTDIFNGGTPDTSNQKYWNGKINWATLVDTKEKYLNKTQRSITEEGLNSCNATLLPINSVLFSSRATIGDVSISKIPVATNQGYKNFVCNNKLLHYEYLYYILKHEAKNIEKLASGMTYPEISKTMISQFKIPLPSLEQQKQIVKKINVLENNIIETKKIIEKYQNDKDSVLKKYL